MKFSKLVLASGVLCLGAGSLAAPAPSNIDMIAKLVADIEALDAELTEAEDVAAIRRLQRTYGYYIDKGLWEDLSALFTEDARASYPAGVFMGRTSIREHIWRNVGDGSIGIKDGRVYNHMVLQPVINVAPGGKEARGRWRVLAMIGRLEDPTGGKPGQASWAGGVYENLYVKEQGVWKIKDLRYYADFAAPYAGGWANVAPLSAEASGAASGGEDPTAARRSRFKLAYPPDLPPEDPCPGYPAACLQPFHYDNPVSGRKRAQ